MPNFFTQFSNQPYPPELRCCFQSPFSPQLPLGPQNSSLSLSLSTTTAPTNLSICPFVLDHCINYLINRTSSKFSFIFTFLLSPSPLQLLLLLDHSMASPQAWPPYTAGRDCSLGFCSVYCPQWCFFYFPPPPPPSHSNFKLSPLLIAIIIVITSAFFIVTGYLVALKYCNNRRHRSPTSLTSTSPSTWLPPSSTGLDASLINKLTIYRYHRGDGPIVNGDSDCSVCLGEFREGDSLRLLPKCSHAFHKSCIDTWLSSHSNCPLCRAGIIGPIEHPIVESEEEDEVVAIQDLEEERGSSEETRDEDGDDDVVIEIREEGYEVRMAGESSAGTALVSVKKSPSPTPGNRVDSL